jgi:hypothetical protein
MQFAAAVALQEGKAMKTQRWLAILVMASMILMPALTAAQEATPVAEGVIVEELGTVVVPAEFVPDEHVAWFGRETIPAGETAPIVACDATSIGAGALIGGQNTQTGRHIQEVWRSDGTHEVIDSRDAITFAVGDVYWLREGGSGGTSVSDGPDDAVTLIAGFGDSSACETNEVPPGYRVDTIGSFGPSVWDEAGLGDGPLAVTFRRVTLDPGASMETTDDRYPVMRGFDTGQLVRQYIDAATGEEISLDGMSGPSPVQWTPLKEGEILVLTNEGNAPLVLVEIQVQPAAADEATAGADQPVATIANSSPPIVGAWVGQNLTVAGTPVGYHLMHVDGAASGSNPNVGLGLGVWETNDDGSVAVLLVYPDADLEIGSFAPGTTLIRATLTVDESGDRAFGTGAILVYDENGALVGEYPDQEWEFARLNVDSTPGWTELEQ